jgi:hypothetical protein
MRNCVVPMLVAAAFGTGCQRVADRFDPQEIIALERVALDRWGKGDPGGSFDIMSAEQTYFDPMTDKRIDGQEALKRYIAPFTGKISIDRVEMIDPKVQRVVIDRELRGLFTSGRATHNAVRRPDRHASRE